MKTVPLKLPADKAAIPGNELSFLIVPLDPAYKAGFAGHLPATHTRLSDSLELRQTEFLCNVLPRHFHGHITSHFIGPATHDICQ